MKNYVQRGDTVTFTAPTGGAASGIPVVIGSLCLIPICDVEEGEEGDGDVMGVFELPKASTDAPTQFQKAYWDATNGVVTTTDSGNTLIGVFMDALEAGTETAAVRLNGVSV